MVFGEPRQRLGGSGGLLGVKRRKTLGGRREGEGGVWEGDKYSTAQLF